MAAPELDPATEEFYRSSMRSPTRRADAYDPATNTWSPVADLPKGLSHAGLAVDGSNIYIAGGYPAQGDGTGQTFQTNAVWKYDTSANTYTAIRSLPAGRGGGALVRLGRNLHFFGGSGKGRTDTGTHWALNIDNPTAWTTLAPMTLARNHLGGAALNGKIYAVAGQTGQDGSSICRNNVDVYNPTTNAWTAVASLPQILSHHNAFVMGGRILAVGGKTAHNGARLANVTAYDPATDSWTELTPLPVAKTQGVADEFNGVIYQTTGNSGTSTCKGVPMAP